MRTTLSRSRRRIGLKQTIGGKKKKIPCAQFEKKKNRETIIEEENYYSSEVGELRKVVGSFVIDIAFTIYYHILSLFAFLLPIPILKKSKLLSF